MTNQERVEKIKAWCLANYEKGGSWIIECFTDLEIEEQFANIREAQRYVQRMRERELECQSW
jgi:hypothetical protein